MQVTRFVIAIVFAGAVVLVAPPARASDCPPGSVDKSEDGFSWCEPTVCTNDGQCSPNELCRPVPLCMQVGTLAGAAARGDAGKRLVVTQRCAPDKSCPQTTVCSDLSRCVSKAAAEKMGMLAAPGASAPPAGAAEDKKVKGACGCVTVGERTTGGGAFLAAAAGVVLAAARRRRRQDDLGRS